MSALICGFARNPGTLIVMRGIQGLGAAIVNPAALAIVMEVFPEGPKRDRALGVWGIVGSSGQVIGIMAGGILTSAIGWRSIFLVNVPIGIAVVVLALRSLPPDVAAGTKPRVDYRGGALLTSGLILLVTVLSRGPQAGWTSPQTLLECVLMLVCLGLFIRREKIRSGRADSQSAVSHPEPRGNGDDDHAARASYCAIFVFAAVYVQEVLHFDAWQAGIAFLPMAVAVTAIAGPVSHPLAQRFGFTSVANLGALLLILGTGTMLFAHAGTSYHVALLPGTVLVGFGAMFVFQMANIVGMGHVPEPLQGSASDLINTSLQIGSALVIALGATTVSTTKQLESAFVVGFAIAILCGAVTMMGLRAPVKRSLMGINVDPKATRPSLPETMLEMTIVLKAPNSRSSTSL